LDDKKRLRRQKGISKAQGKIPITKSQFFQFHLPALSADREAQAEIESLKIEIR
jgi:hypothetical protein